MEYVAAYERNHIEEVYMDNSFMNHRILHGNPPTVAHALALIIYYEGPLSYLKI